MNKNIALLSIALFSFSMNAVNFEVAGRVERKQEADGIKKIITFIGRIKKDDSKEVWTAEAIREDKASINPVLGSSCFKAKLKSDNYEQDLTSWDASTLFEVLSNGYVNQPQNAQGEPVLRKSVWGAKN